MNNTSQMPNVATKDASTVLVLPKEHASFVSGDNESFEAWRARKLKNKSKYV